MTMVFTLAVEVVMVREWVWAGKDLEDDHGDNGGDGDGVDDDGCGM